MRLVSMIFAFLLLAAPAFAADVVEVPDVEGKPIEEALDALDAAGLEVRRISVSGPEVDVVAEQSPEAGAEVTRGAVVTLRVGIRARIETHVPDVTGRRVEDALTILAQAYDVRVTTVTADGHAAGTVVKSDPAPGAALWYRGVLTLEVAEGAAPTASAPAVEPDELPSFLPKIEVPRLAGLEPEAARIAVERAGFRIDVMARREPDAEPRRVVGQDPEPGAERVPGTVLVLYVPAEAPVPSVVGYTQMDAVRALAQSGFATRFAPRKDGRLDARVVSHVPASGELAVCGSPVVLRFDDEKQPEAVTLPDFAPVPDLVGSTRAEALDLLEAAGFDADLDDAPLSEASPKIEWQRPTAFAHLRKGARVRAGFGAAPTEPAAEVSDDVVGIFRRAAGIRETPADKRRRARRR